MNTLPVFGGGALLVVRGWLLCGVVGCVDVGGAGVVLLPPDVGGVDVGGVDVPLGVEPICRIPGMLTARGTLSESPPSCRLMPDLLVAVVLDGVGEGAGAALAAMAGIASSDIAAPTTATNRRIVRTSVRSTRRMSPLRSNRFSRRLHTSAQG